MHGNRFGFVTRDASGRVDDRNRDRRTIRYVTDLAPVAWIRDRLHPFAQDVGSVVPEGFADYARVFHPAHRDGALVTWRAIAEANGRKAHAEMQFGNIAGAWRQSPRPDLWTSPPATGSLELASALVEVLRAHTTTPERCWFAVWEGWGGFDPGTPRFVHPQRRYFLARGAIEAAESSVLEDWVRQSPSMWWPDDRAWFVSTEIDFTYSYVGGTRECIDAILAHPQIEALRARISDRITWDGDRINPSPGPPHVADSPRPDVSWRRRIPRFYRPGATWAYSGEAAVVAPQPRPRRPLLRFVLYALIVAIALVPACLYYAPARTEVFCVVDGTMVSCPPSSRP